MFGKMPTVLVAGDVVTRGRIKSKAPVSQLVNADDTSVTEIKTQLYLES